MSRRLIWCVCLPPILLLALSGCKEPKPDIPLPGANLPRESIGVVPASDQRRLLFAQIVEDDDPRSYSESAIIEGKVFKSFLKALVGVSQDDVRKFTNDEIVFDRLMAQPGLYRGQVVTLARGIVMEVDKVPLPPEYGLPGYSVLVGVFVDSARDVYAFRMLSPPDSKVYDKLRKGIDNDEHPVTRLTGYFMKLYARNTGDPKEPPWRRPLLICPDLEFSKVAPPRHTTEDMARNHMDRFLPSERIDAPGAEERMVVEILPGLNGSKWRIRIDGEELSSDSVGSAEPEAPQPVSAPLKGSDLFLDPDDNKGASPKGPADIAPAVKSSANALPAFIARASSELKKRLPKPQDENPAAVILITAGAPRTPVADVIAALRASGVKRLAMKSER